MKLTTLHEMASMTEMSFVCLNTPYVGLQGVLWCGAGAKKLVRALQEMAFYRVMEFFCPSPPVFLQLFMVAKSVPLSTHLYVHDEGRPEHVSGTHEYGSCMSVPRLLWRHPRSPGRLWQVSHLNAPSGCGFSMCYNCMQLGLGGNGSQHIFH